MSAQAALEEPPVATDKTQYFLFAYEAVPGPDPQSPPQIIAVGPPSMTALVVKATGEVEITLTQQGLPPGTSVFFDPKTPVYWHEYAQPDKGIDQPSWVVDFNAGDTLITYRIVNPAVAKKPVIVAFTPVIVASPPPLTGQILVPDPTIVNIDPTGG